MRWRFSDMASWASCSEQNSTCASPLALPFTSRPMLTPPEAMRKAEKNLMISGSAAEYGSPRILITTLPEETLPFAVPLLPPMTLLQLPLSAPFASCPATPFALPFTLLACDPLPSPEKFLLCLLCCCVALIDRAPVCPVGVKDAAATGALEEVGTIPAATRAFSDK
mmetsp:Transcript_32145/g.53133  ORF Transcript_32145/g.53133 Transcript_32145/m.53133 type:complete len:167 (+) Transcript_32145:626-1126(+)